jgi:hypothetical protein
MWCPIRVNAVLEGLPGFHGSRVDVARGRVTVQFDADVLDASEIARRIDENPDYEASPPLVVREVSRDGVTD